MEDVLAQASAKDGFMIQGAQHPWVSIHSGPILALARSDMHSPSGTETDNASFTPVRLKMSTGQFNGSGGIENTHVDASMPAQAWPFVDLLLLRVL